MVDPALYSSESCEWETPSWLYESLDREFGFTLDPCSTHDNAKCSAHYTIEQDGLKQDWGDDVVFMNPPYGREIGDWMEKAYDSSRWGGTVVCLVPAHTDTSWWHAFAMKGEIRLLRGRLPLTGGEHSAPFPSALVVFRPPTFGLVAMEGTTTRRK